MKIHSILAAAILLLAGRYNALSQSAMFRNGPALTGVTKEAPVYRLHGIVYRFQAAGPIRGIPAVANGLLYIGSGDGNLYAIDQMTGKERWHFHAGSAIYSSVAVAGNRAWFTSRDGWLYAVDAGRGTLAWKLNIGRDLGNENFWDQVTSSPVLVDNKLYVGSGDGHLYAVDAVAGKIIWKYDAGARIRTTPAVFGEHVVFGSHTGHLMDLDRATGKLRWKFATSGVDNVFETRSNDYKSVVCSAAISDGVVVMGGRDGIVYGVDLATGKEIWRHDHKGPWILSAAVSDGVAFIGSGSDGLVKAYDLHTGKEKWTFRAGSATFSSITVAGDLLYFNDVMPSSDVYAIDKNTGAKKWQFSLACRSYSTPVVAGGRVYCAGEDGALYALQGENSKDTTGLRPQTLVYYQGKKPKVQDSYFTDNVDEYLGAYFEAVLNYAEINADGIEKVMQDQITGRQTSVILFVDNRFPVSITRSLPGEKPLIRKYLEAGGKVVLFAPNPIGNLKDTAGNVRGYNDSIPAAVFDIAYKAKKFVRGIYEMTPTPEARLFGITKTWTNFTNTTVIKPDPSITAIVKDENGEIVEWLKSYGGRPGTGLLQLYMMPYEVWPSPLELRSLIEYGVTW